MMTGRGGFREAQMVTQDYIDQFKPPEEEELKKEKKNRILKSKNVPVKKIKPQKDRFETEKEEERIPLSVHNEKMGKLQIKNEKLEEKEKATREDNKKLRSELAKMEKSYKSEKTKNESLEDNYTNLHENYTRVEKELKTLRKNGGDISGEMTKKDKEIEELKKKIKKKDKEISGLKSQIDGLNDVNESLNKEIDELQIQKETVSEKEDQQKEVDTATITRISETEFQSSSFNSTRYKVSLSRDCKFMTFRTDILGSATCINGIIKLPLIAKYVQYTGERKYPVEITDNGGMLIHL